MAKIKSYLPVFPGFYGTIFEPTEDHIIEDGFSFDDYEFNYTDYYIDIARGCVAGIESELLSLGFNIGIEFENVVSPREYNFSNDSINVIYTFKPGCITALRKYLTDNRDPYAVFLRERYTTCSGFISSYLNDVNSWLGYVTLNQLADNPHYLGSMFEFVLGNEGFTYEDLYYKVDNVSLDGWLKISEETFLEEFLEDELYQNIEILDSGNFQILGRDKETHEACYFYRVDSDCNMCFNMLCEVGRVYKPWFEAAIKRLNLRVLSGESDTDVFDVLETINPAQTVLF